MRRIIKDNPIASFTEYHRANPGANWDSFHHDAQDCYVETRLQILIEEQDCLCGYTEICINDVPDLIAATLDNDFGANYKDSTYKIKKEEYSGIYDPVQEQVQDFLYYNQNGEVGPKWTNVCVSTCARLWYAIS